LVDFVGHDNRHRPHRSLNQQAPLKSGLAPTRPVEHPDPTRLRRTDKLGSLIHEYRLVA
jgi:hypothetical protein